MIINVFKLLELRAALQALDTFSFDGKTSYTLMRNLNWISSEITTLDSVRQKMLKELGDPKETDPAYKDFISKWQEFLLSDVEMKDLRKIKFETLNVGNDISKKENVISLRILHALEPIIEDEDENKLSQGVNAETVKKVKKK